MSIWLDKVQDVACKFEILGRIFGFGDIERRLQQKLERAILDLSEASCHQNDPGDDNLQQRVSRETI